MRRYHFPAALIDTLIALRCAVMPAAGDTVPWRLGGTVVAVDKTVVQLVHEVAHAQAEPANPHRLKPTVADWPADRVQHDVENDMHWVASDKEVEHRVRIDPGRFNRMHRVARPRAGIDVLVVNVVDLAIQERDMQHPVHRIEMPARPDRDHGKQHRGIDRAFGPRNQRDMAVGHPPEHQAFPQRPNGNG